MTEQDQFTHQKTLPKQDTQLIVSGIDHSAIVASNDQDLQELNDVVVAYTAEDLESQAAKQINKLLPDADNEPSQEIVPVETISPDDQYPSTSRSINSSVKLREQNIYLNANIRSKDRISDDNSEYEPSDVSERSTDDDIDNFKEKSSPPNKKRRIVSVPKQHTEGRQKDDGTDEAFNRRLSKLKKSKVRALQLRINGEELTFEDKLLLEIDDNDTDVKLKGGRVAKIFWDNLYDYQQKGLNWLLNLHLNGIGGILGDEMGLGKTIQVIALMHCLLRGREKDPDLGYVGLGPTLIVCPTTVMYQWMSEIRRWSPYQRVVIFHSTSTVGLSKSRKRIIKGLCNDKRSGNVIITSYTTLSQQKDVFIENNWHYVILDEGHKIRNPCAQATIAVKELRTPHRLLLTGSPMQNNLRELWSLIDFVSPGKLGALLTFMSELGVPITQGGYANASKVQVRTAYKCACIVRDLIAPVMLRRMKTHVNDVIQLPAKNEQVLFCRLSEKQRQLYVQYLTSRQCADILSGRIDAFIGLTTLRNICNHANFVLPNVDATEDVSINSGKMLVVKQLLTIWKRQNHKVLLFSQSRQMLDILHEYLVFTEKYDCMRMDGRTPIAQRQQLVKQFNENSNVFIFLLTTKVGGLGLNLTGADRVLIFDPDWNPATDTQARERAWRIGQQRPVTIYRLLTSGTIEEKIYHRQIFKQYLANRVLRDPRQRRFFKTNDLHELFTLTELAKDGDATETHVIFAGTNSNVKVPSYKPTEPNIFDLTDDRKRKPSQLFDDDDDDNEIQGNKLSDKKINQLKEMAKRMSKKISSQGAVKQPKALFDGRHVIQGLVKQKRDKRHKKREKQELEVHKQEDTDVLRALFHQSGGAVHSALQHDRIIGDEISSCMHDAVFVEKEASEVAARALKSLQHSVQHEYESQHGRLPFRRFGPRYDPKRNRKQDLDVVDGEINLNQEHRTKFSSASSSSKLKGATSTILFSRIQQRQLGHEDDVNITHDSEDNTGSKRRTQLAKDLHSYLLANNNSRTSKQVLDRFKNDLQPTDTAIFRALLHKLCKFDKKTKIWTLKENIGI